MKVQFGTVFEKIEEYTSQSNTKGIMVHGTAIKEVVSRNGVKYVAQELEKAAPTLRGRPILKDHKNSVDHIVGKVMDSSYNSDEKAIKFKGLITDEKIKELILNGLINHVSIGASVKAMHPSEADNNVMIAEGIEILELSVTPVPGVADASIMPGESFALALENLKKDQDDEEEGEEEDWDETAHKCPECGKMVNGGKPEMDKHAKTHEQDQKVKQEENKMAEQEEMLKIVKDGLAEAILAYDQTWKKEELTKFDMEALKALLAKAKTAKQEKTETKAEAKGVITPIAEVEEKKQDVITMPAGVDEMLKGIKPGTLVVERSAGNRASFWRMPDYKKTRVY